MTRITYRITTPEPGKLYRRWTVIDRKTGEWIARGYEPTLEMARKSARQLVAVHAYQRCPRGNKL